LILNKRTGGFGVDLSCSAYGRVRMFAKINNKHFDSTESSKFFFDPA
jgi:hypothetical protein